MKLRPWKMNNLPKAYSLRHEFFQKVRELRIPITHHNFFVYDMFKNIQLDMIKSIHHLFPF